MIFEYRAKDVLKGKWVCGDLIRTNPDINPDTTSSYKIKNNLVDFNTISIYLNYKDSTGKKIYGYDIIKLNNNKYLIYYDIKQCSYCLLKLNELDMTLFHNDLQYIKIVPEKNWWIKNIKDITVIGNLFDNKELLYGLTYDDIINFNI